MSRKTLDPAYYENNSFADEMESAIKTGTLIKAVPGKSIIDAARDMQAKKKSETVSVQLPKPLVATIKRQAKNASVPWTSYIQKVLETSVSRTAKHGI
jgi:predicted DNA binding CopG/RHH family protein